MWIYVNHVSFTARHPVIPSLARSDWNCSNTKSTALTTCSDLTCSQCTVPQTLKSLFCTAWISMMPISRLGSLMATLLFFCWFSENFPHTPGFEYFKAIPWPPPLDVPPFPVAGSHSAHPAKGWRHSEQLAPSAAGNLADFNFWISGLPDELAEWAKRALAQVSSYSGNVFLDFQDGTYTRKIQFPTQCRVNAESSNVGSNW